MELPQEQTSPYDRGKRTKRRKRALLASASPTQRQGDRGSDDDEPPTQLQKIILARDLPKFTGLRRTQIDAKIKAGTFPKPVKLSERRRAWLEAEVAAWQQVQIAKRDTE